MILAHGTFRSFLGITEKVSYFQSIGVGVVWLSPIFKSPQIDFGYDISDYKSIDPLFGTMADFERMRDEFHKCGEPATRNRDLTIANRRGQ